MSSEAASADTDAAHKYPKELNQFISEVDYTPQQVFSVEAHACQDIYFYGGKVSTRI